MSTSQVNDLSNGYTLVEYETQGHYGIYPTGETQLVQHFSVGPSVTYQAVWQTVRNLAPLQPNGRAKCETTRQARESRYQASTVHGSSKTRMQANCSTGLQDLDFEVASELHTPHHAVANDETPRRLYFEGRRVNARDLWRHQAARRANGRTRANGL